MEYKLLKINLEKHPITREDYTIKLYYFTILHTCISRDNILKGSVGNLLMSYKKTFDIKEKDYRFIKHFNQEYFYIDEVQNDVESILESLKENYPSLDRSKLYIEDYKYLLISDLLYLESNYNAYNYINNSSIKNIAKYLNVEYCELQILLNLFKNLAQNNFVDSSNILSSKKFNSLSYFIDKYKYDFEFNNKQEKSILVMSTMSSGKSTVINSILGQDILPSRNEVSTSKVINIMQNNSLDRTIGYARGNKIALESNLTIDILNDWNMNPYYYEINIESKLYNKFEYKNRLKFIDTPGTNNSLDKGHYDLTHKILNRGDFNVILYVLNATNLSCDDDYFILLKVVDYLNNNKEKKVLFLLNKMDEVDTEAGESLSSIYNNAINYLKNAGINNPDIVSVSAYATKIFRKALNSDTLTRKESSDFLNLYELFIDEEYNLNKYTNVEKTLISDIYNDSEDSFIEIKKEKISKRMISQAIKNSGILNVESYLI